jgi:hypothetical protein
MAAGAGMQEEAVRAAGLVQEAEAKKAEESESESES